MKQGVAVWNYVWSGPELGPLIEECVERGFELVSFVPAQLLPMTGAERADVAAVVRAAGLEVTLHGNCQLNREEISSLVALFGDRLRCFSIDPAMTDSSRGTLFDVSRIVPVLSWINEATTGLECRFGAEDFPLDQLALDFYHTGLEPLLDNPRFGLLIDLGHMNIRLHSMTCFQGQTPIDYFRYLPCPVIELHVHDNNGRADEHKHLGEGTLDLPMVMMALEAIGYDGIATIEVAPGLHQGDPVQSRAQLPATLRTWQDARQACEPGLWEGYIG